MADKKKARDAKAAGGNDKSSGKGGGKSTAATADAGPVAGNVKSRGGDPSPDNRKRGETHASR